METPPGTAVGSTFLFSTEDQYRPRDNRRDRPGNTHGSESPNARAKLRRSSSCVLCPIHAIGVPFFPSRGKYFGSSFEESAKKRYERRKAVMEETRTIEGNGFHPRNLPGLDSSNDLFVETQSVPINRASGYAVATRRPPN